MLANLNIGPMRGLLSHWWPLIIVFIGLYMWWSDTKNVVWSLFVVGVGTILLLNTLDITDINLGDIFWPFIIIVVGINILASAARRPVRQVTRSDEDTTAMLGGTSAQNTSEDYKGGAISSILGGVSLDLSKAVIKKEASINLTVFMGGVDLRVPENVVVKNRATVILGGIEDNTRPVASKAAPVLYLDGTVTMGGVEIKR